MYYGLPARLPNLVSLFWEQLLDAFMHSLFPIVHILSGGSVQTQLFQRSATEYPICVKTRREVGPVTICQEKLDDFKVAFSGGFLQTAVIDSSARCVEELDSFLVAVPACIERRRLVFFVSPGWVDADSDELTKYDVASRGAGESCRCLLSDGCLKRYLGCAKTVSGSA
jgi:hypothetical protein